MVYETRVDGRTTYIYGLRDSATQLFLYVGASMRLRQRFRQHQQGRFRSYQITLEILEAVTENWTAAEQWWIQRLKHDGHPLVNKIGIIRDKDGQHPAQITLFFEKSPFPS